jgi:hypothetical protein
MNKFKMIPGSQAGISGLMLLTELNNMLRSVNTNASQVMKPTVNKSLVIALVRTKWPIEPKKSQFPGLASQL